MQNQVYQSLQQQNNNINLQQNQQKSEQLQYIQIIPEQQTPNYTQQNSLQGNDQEQKLKALTQQEFVTVRNQKVKLAHKTVLFQTSIYLIAFLFSLFFITEGFLPLTLYLLIRLLVCYQGFSAYYMEIKTSKNVKIFYYLSGILFTLECVGDFLIFYVGILFFSLEYDTDSMSIYLKDDNIFLYFLASIVYLITTFVILIFQYNGQKEIAKQENDFKLKIKKQKQILLEEEFQQSCSTKKEEDKQELIIGKPVQNTYAELQNIGQPLIYQPPQIIQAPNQQQQFQINQQYQVYAYQQQ